MSSSQGMANILNGIKLKKGLFMNVGSFSRLDSFVMQIGQSMQIPSEVQGPEQFNFPNEDENKIGSLPSTTSFDSLMQVGKYNADSMAMTSVSESDDSSSSIMSQLSNAFRANEDSILSTMENLGLTLEDLSDKENLSALADAMNEEAVNLGLPTVDNMDNTVDSLYESISAASENEEGGAAAGGGGSSSSQEETSTEIVMINGVPFLETTTTTSGVETVTRTPLGFDNQRVNIKYNNNIA